jgi:uncharacterized membrane-anchored protein YhcB (DUF1043 family)
MDFSTLLFLIIGVPLILVAIGILCLCLRWVLSREQRANQKKLLDTAAKLDEQIGKLENRLGALEDILLDPNKKAASASGRAFDDELNRS